MATWLHSSDCSSCTAAAQCKQTYSTPGPRAAPSDPTRDVVEWVLYGSCISPRLPSTVCRTVARCERKTGGLLFSPASEGEIVSYPQSTTFEHGARSPAGSAAAVRPEVGELHTGHLICLAGSRRPMGAFKDHPRQHGDQFSWTQICCHTRSKNCNLETFARIKLMAFWNGKSLTTTIELN